MFFTGQAIVAGVAYWSARVQGHAERFGWQMYTGHTESPTFTLIRGTGEEMIATRRAVYRYRQELDDDLLSDAVFEHICGLDDDVIAVRITNGTHDTRTEQCAGR